MLAALLQPLLYCCGFWPVFILLEIPQISGPLRVCILLFFSILLLFIWYELVCALFGMGPVLCPPGILKSVSFLLHGRYVKLPVPLKSLTPPACLSPSENAGHHLSNPLASCTQTLNVPAATSPPLLSRGGAVPTPSLPGHSTQSHHRMSILPQRWPGEPGPVISE